ncbi:MAG: transcriptional repressor [Kiritimatiellaeota bacterium]|nr:transcriptional repressor [Kiritimatiellota bacterium]
MLEGRNFRLTERRRVILEALRGSTDHPTVDDVYIRARSRLPRISLATVYRNLEEMAANGLVRKLAPEEGARRYDGQMAPHFHVRCTGCGAVADIPCTAELGRLVRELETGCETDFSIGKVRVEWLGKCPRCRGASAADGGASSGRSVVPKNEKPGVTGVKEKGDR